MKNQAIALVVLGVILSFVLVACGDGWTYVNWDKAQLESIQKAVDEGHQVGYLDPENVVMDYITQHYADKDNVDMSDMPSCKQDGDDYMCDVKLKDGGTLRLWLYQPVKKGKGGIWVVKAYKVIGK